VKALLMFFIAFRIRDNPVITIGDALASFLSKPDTSTRNMSFLDITDIRKKKEGFKSGPKQWNNKQYHWKDTTSKTRRFITIIM
jgi:hypothetical protein